MTIGEAMLAINGEVKRFAGGQFPATVARLVDHLGLDRKMVVAEVNGALVKRQDFDAHPLRDGDKVELVRFVGGG